MPHHAKHLLLLPLIVQTSYGVCVEDPDATIAGLVDAGGGNTIFTTCGVLANFPQYVSTVCNLDPKAAAEPFAPSSLCQETCGTGDDAEDPSSDILVLLQKTNGDPRLFDTYTCGDLAQASDSIIDSVCHPDDLVIWDAYKASDVCCQTCFTPPPQCSDWNMVGQDIDGDASNDNMGESVSISADGKTVAVSATGYDGNGISDTGVVRVLKYDEGDMQWIQSGQDLLGDFASDKFGTSVALSDDGTVLAVGAYYADPNNLISNGQVRVFVQNGDTKQWEKTGEFDGDVSFANLGEAVDLSSDGNTVAMGAGGGGNYAGKVFVYTNDNGTWLAKGTPIDGEASNDSSGTALALSSDGNTVAIGAYRNAALGSRTGHVRVFQHQGSDWNQVGNDINGEAAGDEAGFSVALSSDGNIVAVGAPENEGNGYRAGNARVFRLGTNGQWSKIGQDIDGEAINDFCGSAVALSSDGSILAVGAEINDGNGINSGNVRIYEYDEDDDQWIKIGEDVDGEAGADWFGTSVDMSADGRIFAAGAIYNDENGSSAGHVRVYGC